MIDVATLSLILVFLSIIQVLIFYLLTKRYSHFTGIKTCVLGIFLLSVGGFALIGRYFTMNNSLHIVLSNFFVVVGIYIVYLGLSKFLGIKVRKAVEISVLAAYLIGILYFTYIVDNMNVRIMIVSCCICYFAFVISVQMLFSKKSDRTYSTMLTGIILLGGGIFFFIRGVFAICSAPIDQFFSPSGSQVSLFVAAIMISYLWSFGLVFMIFERVNKEKIMAQKRFQVIYDTIPDMICITDVESGVFIDVNDKFAEKIGKPKQEVIGKNVFDFSIWKSKQAREDCIEKLLRDGRIENYEIELGNNDGTLYTCLISGKLIEFNGKIHVLSVIRDINERKNMERALQLQAQTDMLTGVPNRRFFFEALENEISHSKMTMNDSVYMMIDIDCFKMVNDKFGHAVGDVALKMVADALKSALRASDLFGRIGGDEFGVLLVNTNSSEAEKIAEKMSQNVRDIDLTDDEGIKVYLRVCIGISIYRHGKDKTQDLLERADSAMYQAKEAGRNKIVTIW